MSNNQIILEDDFVFVAKDDDHKINIGRSGRTVKWVNPGEYITPRGAKILFHGGETGGWIIKGGKNGTFVCKHPENGVSYISNYVFYPADHLSVLEVACLGDFDASKINYDNLEKIHLSDHAWSRLEEILEEEATPAPALVELFRKRNDKEKLRKELREAQENNSEE